ncbi:MAG: 16S rRNA (cytidine(1402)-2'-O)-methyltransferase [Desulfobacteraceae bacterium]|nr:16S rRNA (cytidine(1402)-2'-O)-methyltransferase [Desulfobacteraceae bacterium]MCB9494673.1 16S rRNA (cytidine(1402)-2'-O)-methyltransferase [Desulfobacteraceae bacterium]
MNDTPVIYIVATPIGNIDDITLRALKVLKSADLIAAEDTRKTGKLLSCLGIKSKMTSFHDHNENEKSDYIIDLTLQGKKVALVSDAGTPLISDPGFRLVEKASKKGIKLVPVPGASALTALVSVSGLATDRFAFFGFLPAKESSRNKILNDLINSDFPIMFYESPRRIIKTIDEIIEKTGDREAVLGRELTKIHEEILRGTLSAIRQILSDRESVKGEIALLVQGGKINSEEIDIYQVVKSELEKTSLKPKQTAEKIALEYNLKKNEVYEIILKIKGKK